MPSGEQFLYFHTDKGMHPPPPPMPLRGKIMNEEGEAKRGGGYVYEK
jgi:hypothetical protein